MTKSVKKITAPKRETIDRNGVSIEKITFPDGLEKVVVKGEAKVKPNPSKDA